MAGKRKVPVGKRKNGGAVDVVEGLASPLDVAISENDRATLDLVREALDRRRVALAFQPVVLARDPGRVAFHEGLIRLMDANGRVIPARDFMPQVEAHELGRRIDCVALEAGLDTLMHEPDLRIAVNMSARSIGYPPFQRLLERELPRMPGVAERLILEITETSAMQVPELVAAFMEEFQGKGVAFSLDDFGAGPMVVRYFRDFFFDMVKIDGQFVRKLQSNSDNQAVVAALIGIARQFDMYCVAESVEAEAEARVLQAMGVDCLQGYLYGVPTMKPYWLRDKARRA